MSLKCHRMCHMCSYSMKLVQLHISIFYKSSQTHKFSHEELRNEAQTISCCSHHLFQVRFHFNCGSFKLKLTAQITSKEYRFASPHWQGPGSDTQVAPAAVESLWAVQTSPQRALEISSPACDCLLPSAPFLCSPQLLALQRFWSATVSLMCYFGFSVCCVRTAFRSPSNSSVPFLCLSAKELRLI